jgi:endonuclease G
MRNTAIGRVATVLLFMIVLMAGCTGVDVASLFSHDGDGAEGFAAPAVAPAFSDLVPGVGLGEMWFAHTNYQGSYVESWELSRWIAYRLTAEMINGLGVRDDDFRPDPAIPTGSAESGDYTGSGYDRGHLAPAADMTITQEVMDESFFMSNIAPQTPALNRGEWRSVEGLIRSWVLSEDDMYVITGPIISEPFATIGANEVAIPSAYFKVVAEFSPPVARAIAFIFPNEDHIDGIASYIVSIDEVEARTGLNFFSALEDDYEEAFEQAIMIRAFDFSDTDVTLEPGDVPADQGDIRIVHVTAHPTESEQITIKNFSSYTVSLSGWGLGDRNDPRAYRFPDSQAIGPGQSLRITRTTLGFQINNSGELLVLFNGSTTIDSWEN